MLLALDVGNTNIKIAVFNGDKIVGSWRLAVKQSRTADEFGIVLGSFFDIKKIKFNDIDGVIMSSVVPGLNYTIEHACDYYLKMKPMVVTSDMKLNIKLNYLNPGTLGADRIVNAVAATKLYSAPAIVVDLGTASTFGVVNRESEFLGGAIAPGILTSVTSLVDNASKLPLIELNRPNTYIGQDTITNMQIGAVVGFRGLVECIIKNIKMQLNEPEVKVVATGGLTSLIEDKNFPFVDVYDRALTLKGLKILYDMNK